MSTVAVPGLGQSKCSILLCTLTKVSVPLSEIRLTYNPEVRYVFQIA